MKAKLATRIRTVECESLHDYLSRVAEIIAAKPDNGQGKALLWRGQASADWQLEPKLQREWDGDAVGMKRAEASMLNEFREAAPFLLPSGVSNDWDRLSIAQHYGMTTRLLDWTMNHMVALWFSLSIPMQCDAAVWAFRPRESNVLVPAQLGQINPFELKRTMVFRPVAHSLRVTMQSGWHTVHRMGKRPDQNIGLLAIDKMKYHKPHLTKIIIRAHRRSSILDALQATGISVTTVFGDLVSLCANISDRNKRNSPGIQD